MTPTPASWPTPTPIPYVYATPVFDFQDGSYIVAENMVQGYQMLNSAGGMDSIFVVLIILMLVGGLWSINRHLSQLGN
jgi:hypothetical protein